MFKLFNSTIATGACSCSVVLFLMRLETFDKVLPAAGFCYYFKAFLDDSRYMSLTCGRLGTVSYGKPPVLLRDNSG